MTRLLIIFMISPIFLLSGCGNPKLEQCKKEASHYWNANATGSAKSDNPKYWAAIELCKKKYP